MAGGNSKARSLVIGMSEYDAAACELESAQGVLELCCEQLTSRAPAHVALHAVLRSIAAARKALRTGRIVKGVAHG